MLNSKTKSDRLSVYHRIKQYQQLGYRGEIWPQAPGQKHPSTLKQDGSWGNCCKWNSREFDPEWAKDMDPNCGICIRNKHFPFIDIDLEDEKLVQTVRDVVFRHLGRGAIRSRTNSNRIGIAYRSNEPIPPIKSVLFLNTYEPRVREGVDILTRTQFVAEGIHPSGGQYQFELKPAVELPLVTLEQLQKLREALLLCIPNDYVREKHSSHGITSHEKDLEHIDLYHDFEIITDDGIVTVGEILSDREKWHGVHCRDPYEPDYAPENNRIGIIYINQRNPLIKSFAHGEKLYFLHDHRVGEKLAKKNLSEVELCVGQPATLCDAMNRQEAANLQEIGIHAIP